MGQYRHTDDLPISKDDVQCEITQSNQSDFKIDHIRQITNHKDDCQLIAHSL